MVVRRRRVKHENTFEQRLAEEVVRFNELAKLTPPGMQRDLYLKRARQAETASHINEWLKSPGLHLPQEMKHFKVRVT